MPACGSETTCLEGLWPPKGQGGASPRCPGSPNSELREARPNLPQPTIRRRRGLLVELLIWFCRKLLAVPCAWLSGWLCLLWLCLSWPLGILERQRRGPCVLVGGGSTVQAVQLARGLRRCGARVVVCELEGLFGLARFSSACARYYSLPRPQEGQAAPYIAALREIVRRERCTSYVPVSASCSAYFDGLAKPHLERLGCECFVPGTRELAMLDDPLELARRAAVQGLPQPQHRLLDNLEEAAQFYGPAGLAGRRYLAQPAGPQGMRERPEIRLPASLPEFRRLLGRASMDTRQWLVLLEPTSGARFVTCTTVRDSRLLANVTCRVDEAHGVLVPERRPEVERWLERFLQRPWPGVPLSGHLSFRLATLEDRPGELVALGCRVGIGLPYLAHSRLQAELLLSRDIQTRALLEAASRSIDQAEALFLFWDPLPYCAYRYLQMPFGRLLEALGAQHKPPLAVVQ